MSKAFLTLLKDVDSDDMAIKVSPYLQPQIQFANEQQAYQCFQDNGGINAYVLRLTELLKLHKDIKHIVAFSAGAAAVYEAMTELSDIKLTLFYPGQIRYFLDKQPKNPCHIIFGASEPHFVLADVIEVLSQQSNVKVEQNTYQHGFMNKNSKGFDKTAYYDYCQMLATQLVYK